LAFSQTTCSVENTDAKFVSNYGDCYEKNLKPMFESEKTKADGEKNANLEETMKFV